MSDSQYDPDRQGLTFNDRLPAFESGADDPRAYLERCLAAVDAREPKVQAFASLNRETAREAADQSAARWRDGRPLSPIDGMPIGVKDLLETRDMPTEMNCKAYAGNFPNRDNAAVRALREAGAVIFGKTVTAELGGSEPGPTTNPWDSRRTPGGSSSGSAAAVAADMAPGAIGTQVGGSIIRPAAFCGNIALKPSQGGVNRGERQATSMSTHGLHANSFEDMWRPTMEIVSRVGGDPGKTGVAGPMSAPPATMPRRLIALQTAGWDVVDDDSKNAFATLTARIEAAGVEVLRRDASPVVERLERALADAAAICVAITGWENRWLTRNLLDAHGPDGISKRIQAVLARSEAMSVQDYRDALMEREIAQTAFRSLAADADAAIALACPGPANFWSGDTDEEPPLFRPTGDAIFNYPSSMLFAPVVTTPHMRVDGMPVGLQTMGRPGADARVAAIARWLHENVAPVTV